MAILWSDFADIDLLVEGNHDTGEGSYALQLATIPSTAMTASEGVLIYALAMSAIPTASATVQIRDDAGNVLFEERLTPIQRVTEGGVFEALFRRTFALVFDAKGIGILPNGGSIWMVGTFGAFAFPFNFLEHLYGTFVACVDDHVWLPASTGERFTNDIHEIFLETEPQVTTLIFSYTLGNNLNMIGNVNCQDTFEFYWRDASGFWLDANGVIISTGPATDPSFTIDADTPSVVTATVAIPTNATSLLVRAVSSGGCTSLTVSALDLRPYQPGLQYVDITITESINPDTLLIQRVWHGDFFGIPVATTTERTLSGVTPIPTFQSSDIPDGLYAAMAIVGGTGEISFENGLVWQDVITRSVPPTTGHDVTNAFSVAIAIYIGFLTEPSATWVATFPAPILVPLVISPDETVDQSGGVYSIIGAEHARVSVTGKATAQIIG